MDHQPQRRLLNIDIGGMLQRAKTGVVRAAAFLGVSEHVLEQELPSSLNLGGASDCNSCRTPFLTRWPPKSNRPSGIGFSATLCES